MGRVDLVYAERASQLCDGRAGCKVGPVVGEVKNPLVDNHELVVVFEKKVVGLDNRKTVEGRAQTNDTRISGKSFHTNCFCFGCGLTDDLCRCRAGCKVCPVTVDVKNPLVDNHELIVVCEKKVYGCKLLPAPSCAESGGP